jgi:tight adherence protein B
MFPVLLLAFSAALSLGLVGFAFAGPSASKAKLRRIDAMKARHIGGSEGAVQVQMRRILANRETRLDSYFTRFMPKPDMLRKRLERTGKTWTLGRFGMVCVGIVVVLGGLMMLKGVPILLALLIAMIIGLGAPHKFITIMINRRVNKFTSKFPDAIELLVRGLRSGLPISETIQVVGSEVPGPVGVEFRLVADRIKIGRTMDAALQETADRLLTAEFQFFVITLAIQRETGGNLAETLGNLAEVLRKRAQMKLKIKAMSSESKASAYIIGSLPFFVFGIIYFVNGHYMQQFFEQQRLEIAGACGLLWMALGAFVMAKMISFEI